MTQLVLTDEQALKLLQCRESIELVDQNGRHLGYVSQDFSPTEIAAAERRAGSIGPWYTTREVIEYLNSTPCQD